MPKLKTHKSTAKRFHLSRPKKARGRKAKVMKRVAGQDHFNARESGKVTMKKRRDTMLAKVEVKRVKSFLPYY